MRLVWLPVIFLTENVTFSPPLDTFLFDIFNKFVPTKPFPTKLIGAHIKYLLLKSVYDSYLLGHNESISSKKMTQGAELRARAKQARTARSDSPTYMFNNSGPKDKGFIIIQNILFYFFKVLIKDYVYVSCP